MLKLYLPHAFNFYSSPLRERLNVDASSQELLLILEDHWNRSPDLQSVPIFSASGLASQSLKVYQTYIEMMNDAIKQAFQVQPSHSLGFWLQYLLSSPLCQVVVHSMIG